MTARFQDGVLQLDERGEGGTGPRESGKCGDEVSGGALRPFMGGAFWIPAICFAAESLRRKDTEGESAPRRHTGSGNSWIASFRTLHVVGIVSFNGRARSSVVAIGWYCDWSCEEMSKIRPSRPCSHAVINGETRSSILGIFDSSTPSH
jgi:hypothetical protein